MEAPANPAAGPSRAAPWAVAGAVAGLAAAAVFFGGASGDGSVLELALLAVAACGGGLLAATLGFVSLPRLEPAGVATLAALLALIGWVGLSIVWSVAGDRSWSALNKGLVYVLFLLAGILLGCHGGRCARVAAGLLAVVLGLALAWALAGKAFPDLFPDGGRIARLRNPVGYWNGLALLADAALPLGLWLATAFAPRRWRVAGALLFYAAVLTGLLTQSRAGVAAAVGGLARGSGWWASGGSRGHSSPSSRACPPSSSAPGRSRGPRSSTTEPRTPSVSTTVRCSACSPSRAPRSPRRACCSRWGGSRWSAGARWAGRS